MTAAVQPITPTIPTTHAPTLTSKVVDFGIRETVGIGLNYSVGYGFGWLAGIPDKHSLATLFAASFPAREATSYVSKKALSCTPETPWRNIAANLISGTSASVASILGCRHFGYQMTPQIINISLMPAFVPPISEFYQRISKCTAETPNWKLAAQITAIVTASFLSAQTMNQLGLEIDPATHVLEQIKGLTILAGITGIFKGISALTKMLEEPPVVEIPTEETKEAEEAFEDAEELELPSDEEVTVNNSDEEVIASNSLEKKQLTNTKQE